MAMPIPPPMQRDATPFWPPVLCSACNKVTSTLQPDMPIGWPSEMAPPLTFTWRLKACFNVSSLYCSFSRSCVKLLLCLRSDRALSPRRETEQQTPRWSQINRLGLVASLLFPPVKHNYNTKGFFKCSRILLLFPVLTAVLMAGIGPVPMTAGSRPAWAEDTTLARGFMPRFSASVWLMRTTAAAPSLIPEV